ncbi:hypothetical protein F5Y11DRAFT_338852 [Daldinia sp. FL1419]|nr:hypothetical protein F5Y11DRAFT_338852 [Daldinia sp. FL1419]
MSYPWTYVRNIIWYLVFVSILPFVSIRAQNYVNRTMKRLSSPLVCINHYLKGLSRNGVRGQAGEPKIVEK